MAAPVARPRGADGATRRAHWQCDAHALRLQTVDARTSTPCPPPPLFSNRKLDYFTSPVCTDAASCSNRCPSSQLVLCCGCICLHSSLHAYQLWHKSSELPFTWNYTAHVLLVKAQDMLTRRVAKVLRDGELLSETALLVRLA
eukprot:6209487-Pleurochrysis_carterae.AAC.3